ncbi:PIN domain-containing protein [Capnocytophaga sp. Marseille-Q4570]|jgi:PIN domain-containing protein|uniref:PIN domain-containing protein n=1 Tax=Capnocytophaga bilenii TaxID=2819369 RepID=A0ABS3PW62_9FLAO|nr:PIN domain-containing protein [Capnocytophaga bilenii]MBO1883561.1 PIN domain-containing protein [Capnocytophaga bilenii]
MKRIFIDTNILLDLVMARRKFYQDANRLFQYCEQRGIKTYISSISIATINYLLLKSYKEEEVKNFLETIYNLTEILPFYKDIIFKAHQSNFKDLEDGFQYFTAKENNLKIIITRNQKDFKVDDISILTPKEFVDYRF